MPGNARQCVAKLVTKLAATLERLELIIPKQSMDHEGWVAPISATASCETLQYYRLQLANTSRAEVCNVKSTPAWRYTGLMAVKSRADLEEWASYEAHPAGP